LEDKLLLIENRFDILASSISTFKKKEENAIRNLKSRFVTVVADFGNYVFGSDAGVKRYSFANLPALAVFKNLMGPLRSCIKEFDTLMSQASDICMADAPAYELFCSDLVDKRLLSFYKELLLSFDEFPHASYIFYKDQDLFNLQPNNFKHIQIAVKLLRAFMYLYKSNQSNLFNRIELAALKEVMSRLHDFLLWDNHRTNVYSNYYTGFYRTAISEMSGFNVNVKNPKNPDQVEAQVKALVLRLDAFCIINDFKILQKLFDKTTLTQ